MNAPFFPAVRAPDRADAWLAALRLVARHYRLPEPGEGDRLAALWSGDGDETARIAALARGAGLRVHILGPDAARLTPEHLPLIVAFKTGDIGVATAIDDAGMVALALTGEGGLESAIPADRLLARAARVVAARPARAVRDSRADGYARPYAPHWLRAILLRDRSAYGHVLVASLVANLLALAGVLFSMQVYDRVIPAGSFPTLYVLFAGVMLALGFDFLFRFLRMRIIDMVGKRADLRMSDAVFGHALRVRGGDRPGSAGTFMAQLRDLDQVREMLTSTTVAAVADLPFFLLFLAIFWFIAGPPLALVPLAALVLLLAPGIVAQPRLRALANASMRDAALRNALLVEAVQGLDDIKTLQAEPRFEQQWRQCNAAAAEAQLRLRGLTNGLTVWAQTVQTGVYAATILVGAPLVMAGEITTGVLVAASILGTRMMAPMAQVAQLLNRLQQAKVGIAGLDRLMALPLDVPDEGQRIQRAAIAGEYRMEGAIFRRGDANAPAALTVARLHIAPGETIAVLGRNGAGKSTLLQACAGLLRPAAGEVLLDGLALHQIDPADVRRDVGLLGQGSRLFQGTIRENLVLGCPRAGTGEILHALEVAGAHGFVRRLRAGLDHMIPEGGGGLSGGETQALLLARLILRDPRVVLLDEPTAAMDEGAERAFVERFRAWRGDRTVIVATHRMRVLDLAARAIVVQGGAIALDGPKETVLRAMQATARGKVA